MGVELLRYDADVDSTYESHVSTTAQAYDTIAAEYVTLVGDGLASLPLDRSIVSAFADLVLRDGTGPVGDLGCGPGYVSSYLHGLGLKVFGVDASPELVGHARRIYPDLQFSVGSMTTLDNADETLGGIVAWYSIIHAPPVEIPKYFAEFHRVLAPGGHLLLAFFESEEGPLVPFDHKVTTAYRWPVGHLAEVAAAAGFQEVGRMLRQPLESERFRRGHLILRKV
ncbi:methyltransferase domain-containing protein [Streptomyces sp. NPDC079020]|uniref:class I SAM-dependent methyltransferase n=1 Tax=Streptomyces sp. NPDC079020 TaxID=3365722 RepID=UPI0037D4A151